MRKFLVVAGLAMAGTAGGGGVGFWFLAGQTLVSNAGLGTGLCASGTTNSLCQAAGGTSNYISLGDGFHFGFRGGFSSGDHLGYEVGYMYNRTSLQFNNPVSPSEGMAYHQVAFNTLYYATNPDAKVRPFVTGGL